MNRDLLRGGPTAAAPPPRDELPPGFVLNEPFTTNPSNVAFVTLIAMTVRSWLPTDDTPWITVDVVARSTTISAVDPVFA